MLNSDEERLKKCIQGGVKVRDKQQEQGDA